MEPTQPAYYIFLDIDGVLLSLADKEIGSKTPSKEALAYADSHQEYLIKNRNCYSNNYWSLVLVSYFSKTALKHLDDLITKIEKAARPMIVLSSSWREGRSLQELREIYFGMYSFSRYIVDKTAKSRWDRSGADEIQDWLNDHPDATNFVILDDCDAGYSKRFGERFIRIDNNFLTEDDTAKAFALFEDALKSR